MSLIGIDSYFCIIRYFPHFINFATYTVRDKLSHTSPSLFNRGNRVSSRTVETKVYESQYFYVTNSLRYKILTEKQTIENVVAYSYHILNLIVNLNYLINGEIYVIELDFNNIWSLCRYRTPPLGDFTRLHLGI